METKLISSKLLLILTLLLFCILSAGCDKKETNMMLSKLVGFKVVDQRMDIESGQWHHTTFTAKNTGTLWTFVESNNNTPINVVVISEKEYQRIPDRLSAASMRSPHNPINDLIEKSVEAGEKYYVVAYSEEQSEVLADISIQSYFFDDK